MYKSVKIPATLFVLFPLLLFRAGKVFGATGTEVAACSPRRGWKSGRGGRKWRMQSAKAR